ncbi:MAG: PIG-L family deacetylase [Pseudomonadota bacterium]
MIFKFDLRSWNKTLNVAILEDHMFFTDCFQRILYSILCERSAANGKNPHQDWVKSSAVVFSPHFDDETLGCGGTIIKKIRAGAEVQLVFMTDGSTSHRHLMSSDRLRKIRMSEGAAAAKCLGIKPENVIFLNIAEGQLEKYSLEARLKVRAVLEQFHPEDVYVPHRQEPLLWSADHIATHTIVVSELRNFKTVKTLWEYPIWYWFHWPWVKLEFRQRQYASIICRNSLIYRFGLRSYSDLDSCVWIKDDLNLKMKALLQHRSQMTRLIPDARWSTLADIADGDFIDLFFRDFEFFAQTELV